MSHQLSPISRLTAILGALVLAIAACGGATPTTSQAAGTTPAPATPAPAASQATPSDGAVPSLDLSSFHSGADLEALLPNTLCGQPTEKLSFSGADATTDESVAAVVTALGRSPADVTLAIAGNSGECSTILLLALRISGADGGRFEQLLIDSREQQDGTRPTKANVGGKDVWVFVPSSGLSSWAYFRGDTFLAVTATNEADAAKGLAVMP